MVHNHKDHYPHKSEDQLRGQGHQIFLTIIDTKKTFRKCSVASKFMIYSLIGDDIWIYRIKLDQKIISFL